MTKQVNIHEAKTHLSRLLEAVERGEEFVIARAGKPIATLSAYTTEGEDFRDGLSIGHGSVMGEVATAYRPGTTGDAVVSDLVRRAVAGEEIVLSGDGAHSVRLVAVRRAPDAETKRQILEEFQAVAASKVTPGPSAARSQDFLYDEDGLPG